MKLLSPAFSLYGMHSSLLYAAVNVRDKRCGTLGFSLISSGRHDKYFDSSEGRPGALEKDGNVVWSNCFLKSGLGSFEFLGTNSGFPATGVKGGTTLFQIMFWHTL